MARNRQRLAKVIHVAVFEDLGLRTGEAASVNDAGMVFRVAENDVLGANERCNRADVGGEPGREKERGLCIFKSG